MEMGIAYLREIKSYTLHDAMYCRPCASNCLLHEIMRNAKQCPLLVEYKTKPKGKHLKKTTATEMRTKQCSWVSHMFINCTYRTGKCGKATFVFTGCVLLRHLFIIYCRIELLTSKNGIKNKDIHTILWHCFLNNKTSRQSRIQSRLTWI